MTRGTDAVGQFRDYSYDPNGNLSPALRRRRSPHFTPAIERALSRVSSFTLLGAAGFRGRVFPLLTPSFPQLVLALSLPGCADFFLCQFNRGRVFPSDILLRHMSPHIHFYDRHSAVDHFFIEIHQGPARLPRCGDD